MKDFQPSQIRNIALVSQHGTGKTSLAEALLFRTKAITRHGKIEDGTTALDFTPEGDLVLQGTDDKAPDASAQRPQSQSPGRAASWAR